MARIKITSLLKRRQTSVNSTLRIRKRTRLKNFLVNRIHNLKNLVPKARGFGKIRGRISNRLKIMRYKRNRRIFLRKKSGLILAQGSSIWLIIIEYYQKYRLYIHIIMVITLPPVYRDIIRPYIIYIAPHIIFTNPYIHNDISKRIVEEIANPHDDGVIFRRIFIPEDLIQRFQRVFQDPYLLAEDRQTALKGLVTPLLDPVQRLTLIDRMNFFGGLLNGLAQINPDAFKEILETLIILVKSGLISSVARLMLLKILSNLPMNLPLLKQLIELLKNYQDNKPFDQ